MPNKQKLLTFLVPFILLLLMMAGCSSGTATTTVSNTTTPAATTTSTVPITTTSVAPTTTSPITVTTSAAKPASFTVTDMMGRTVVIPAEVKTVATFGAIGVINTFVETMGCGDRILNQMSPSFTKTNQWKMQYVFAPQIANGPLFEDSSKEIQIETVLQNKPDLCISMVKDTVTLLESKGLTVIYLEWKEQSDVETCITLLGEALGKQDIAKDYIDYFSDTVVKAESLAAGIAEVDKVKVLYGSITTYTQPHIIAEWWITEAGGISVTKEDHSDSESFVYTLEDLLQWNPEVMVVAKSAMLDELKTDSRLSNIDAIANNRVYLIPTVGHVWGNRTTEQPLVILWMMNKLYPDIMTDKMFSEEISYFYEHFFQTQLTDEQIAEIMK